jgi:transcriptional regulator with XRE-family HTH domain
MVQNSEEITGRRISEWRKKNGLSQQDLAQMLGVSLPTIKRWETDESTPRDRHLTAIAALLGGTAVASPVGGGSALSLGLLGTLGPMGVILAGITALAGLMANKPGPKVAVESQKFEMPRSLQEKDVKQEITKHLWQVLQQVSLEFPVPDSAQERADLEKVKLTINIDKVLSDKFQEEADLRGFTQSRLLESLLWLFLEMPSLSFQKNPVAPRDSLPDENNSTRDSGELKA